jgi:hypothetical protein
MNWRLSEWDVEVKMVEAATEKAEFFLQATARSALVSHATLTLYPFFRVIAES